jgi:DNA-directed RNA polymerase specialized sigma24 family protein
MNTGSKVKNLSQGSLSLFQEGLSPVTGQLFNTGDEFAEQESSADLILEQFAFNELLSWLDPDPEAAGRRYELIRHKLITLFTCRGCMFPDELADETINRVTRKMPQIKPRYVGSPARYFYGVAKKVYQEYLRREHVQKLLPISFDKEDLEDLFRPLDYALSKLEQADRELVLSYYQEDGHTKIEHRKALAKQMGLNRNTLRLRIYRIKSEIRSYLKMQK